MLDCKESSFFEAAVPEEFRRTVGIQMLGSEAAAWRALEMLGPFEETAGECSAASSNQDEYRTKATACSEVWHLASQYLKDRGAEQSSPRLGAFVGEFDRLDTAVRNMAAALQSLSDTARHELLMSAPSNSYWAIQSDRMGLPVPSMYNMDGASGAWLRRLIALSVQVRRTRQVFLTEHGVPKGRPVDRGGNTNRYKALHGPATLAFVNCGWWVFETFHPGKASGTEGGPLHVFLMHVFEYATGLDPEKHSKLTTWLKRCSRANRKYYEILLRQAAIRKELEAAPSEDVHHIGKLEDEDAELDQIRRTSVQNIYQFHRPLPRWVRNRP